MKHRHPLAAAALAVAGFLTAVVAPAPARADGSSPTVFHGRAEAAGVFSAVNFPPLVDGFFVYSLSEAQNDTGFGANGAFYPGFLVGFVMADNKVPMPPGTAETRYPQGPTAESSVGPFARSAGKSTPDGTSGSTRVAGQPGLGLGEASSSVQASADAVTSKAAVALQNVNLGNGAFVVQALVAEAAAAATRSAGQAKAVGSVELSRVSVNGTPIVITPRGVKLADQEGRELPDSADSVLASAGVTIRRLPDRSEIRPDGTQSTFETGGIEVTWRQGESTVTQVLGRVRVQANGQWSQ
jgi:hypothetical protein